MSPALATFSPIDVVTVVTKFSSSPIAAANSFNVSRRAGAESTRSATASSTYAFVEITSVLTEIAPVASL